MNWVRTAAILVVMAVVFPVTKSAGNQDNPAVAATRRLVGDYRIIPGERIGTVRLGEATRDDFRMRYGLTFTYGLQRVSDVEWHWPERNFGLGPGGAWDQPFYFAFCQSNGRLFSALAFRAASWYPDVELLRLFVRRLSVPEGITAANRLHRWLEEFGQPLVVLSDVLPNFPLTLLPNGLALSDGTTNLVFVGVYDVGICKDRPLGGIYVPHLGRIEDAKLRFGRSSDPSRSTVSNLTVGEVPEVSGSELFYLGVEVTFPPRHREVSVMLKRKITRVTTDQTGAQRIETVVESEHFHRINPGETRLVRVFEIGWRPREGDWKVEISANSVVIAVGSFRNKK